jgi:hypothetical protein
MLDFELRGTKLLVGSQLGGPEGHGQLLDHVQDLRAAELAKASIEPIKTKKRDLFA